MKEMSDIRQQIIRNALFAAFLEGQHVLTTKELAKRAGHSPGSISRWFSDAPGGHCPGVEHCLRTVRAGNGSRNVDAYRLSRNYLRDRYLELAEKEIA